MYNSIGERMNKLYIDFETYSEVDIIKHGGMAYAKHESTQPLMLGYALNDYPVQLWTPDKPAPFNDWPMTWPQVKIYAHNAEFDIRIWNWIMTKHFGWPFIDHDAVVDTMALCASYSLPLSLEDAGNAMGLTMPKSKEGKALIKLFCSPNKKGEQPMPWDYPVEWKRFCNYCMRDVEAMRELVSLLPRDDLIPQEREIWDVTCKMNARGLPVEVGEAIIIRKAITKYMNANKPKLMAMTGGAVNSPFQYGAIKDWINAQGYEVENTEKSTITRALDDPDCPDHVKKFLTLKQELGKSSTAKYNKIIDQAVPGKLNSSWVCDNLYYHGAGPGRWTGRGFQMHNLPRDKFKTDEEVEETIAAFLAANVVDDPVGAGKKLIRPMIKAPDGYSLLVSDYDSIENRLLHWHAHDEVTLEKFRQDLDQYIDMATDRYGVPYDEVTSSQRFMGKVIILGCGFGMGKDTFVKTARDQFGVVVEEHEAYEAVQAYRKKYPEVKALWKGLKEAAAGAVMTGQKHTFNRITFGTFTIHGHRWLAMLLPSGKCIYYKNPAVEARYIPGYEHMGKVGTVTHEGRHPKFKKWVRLALIPGRITENAVQGSAREVMGDGLVQVEKKMPEAIPIGTVHDEAIAIIKNDDIRDDTIERYNRHLCSAKWLGDCPITATGYIAKRYRKD